MSIPDRIIFAALGVGTLAAVMGGVYLKGRHEEAAKLKPVIAQAQGVARRSDQVSILTHSTAAAEVATVKRVGAVKEVTAAAITAVHTAALQEVPADAPQGSPNVFRPAVAAALRDGLAGLRLQDAEAGAEADPLPDPR